MLPNRLILFDGDCNLCNRSIQFVLSHDTKGVFRFASLQSPIGQAILEQHGLSQDEFDTVVLLKDGQLLTHSTAVLTIAHELRLPLSWAYALILVPRPIRDRAYRFVSAHRYRWFGQPKMMCWLPTPTLSRRFLE